MRKQVSVSYNGTCFFLLDKMKQTQNVKGARYKMDNIRKNIALLYVEFCLFLEGLTSYNDIVERRNIYEIIYNDE